MNVRSLSFENVMQVSTMPGICSCDYGSHFLSKTENIRAEALYISLRMKHAHHAFDNSRTLGGFLSCKNSRPSARMISDTLEVEKQRQNESTKGAQARFKLGTLTTKCGCVFEKFHL